VIGEGDVAPPLEGPASDGSRVSLASYRGQPVVVFFYPKDNTPVCTKEACGFRDHTAEIRALGAAVLGVSNDSPESHAGFAAKHGLDYPLVSDVDGGIGKAYGVARMGGLLAGWIPPRRVTFVIDGGGVVRRVLEGEFNAGTHVDGALAALRALGTTPAP
jgi:peroxiredoxin Q/BCP